MSGLLTEYSDDTLEIARLTASTHLRVPFEREALLLSKVGAEGRQQLPPEAIHNLNQRFRLVIRGYVE